jgi:hypothetical protein
LISRNLWYSFSVLNPIFFQSIFIVFVFL